ncbi:MAG TPA: hypothetical protein VMW94_01850 [Actinomycetes bacterium]|nr:hypothetical protein [Actinomycetes bacterium]
MITSLQRLAAEVQSRIAAEPERGDVPGWVLVTVMTAGLVTTLWIVADDQLRQIFSSALGRVTGP